ncbi:MAG: hypothetical protein K0R54_4614 [Clostridiaceae bacterium]|jgi:hypothetical protein|nr:hypothetical protein [Clostridiaceae bacterium]
MVVRLSCNADNCVNNLNGLCSANTIKVNGPNSHSSGGTECETFAARGIRNALSNLTNMNIPGEIRQLFSTSTIEMSPNVKCDAYNCVHNSGRKCMAGNIQVTGPNARVSADTKCETFIE